MVSFYPYTHDAALELLNTDRRKERGRPLENNTRLVMTRDGSPGVKYHYTVIVEYLPNGHMLLANGGYSSSPTTIQRVRTYGSNHVFSERGQWYVRLEPNAKDPQPARVDRTVPKPYTVSDPGPEPVKSDVGCTAGSILSILHENEIMSVFRADLKDDDEIIRVISGSASGNDRYDRVEIKRTWTERLFIGEESYQYGDEWWRIFARGAFTSSVAKDGTKYKQCEHCAAFTRLREAWRQRYHGSWSSRRFDGQDGFKTYAEMMERFGTVEAWHDAYLADFRARREYLKIAREWDERNRVPFFDGIEVNSDGYALRLRATGPSPAKLRRHEAAVKKMQKRIDAYVKLAVETLSKGMPMPGSGDCWYCLMKTDSGKTLGDESNNHDHLLYHMEEKYVVPSLLSNALLARGLSHTGVYLQLDMNQDAGTMGGKRSSYDNVRRDLRRYLSERLLPTAPTN